MDELIQRSTPLLRWRGALLKLECLRPSGGFDDRALAIFPALPRGIEATLAATAGSALAAARWARVHGIQLHVALYGAASHEMIEALRLWGATFERFPTRQEALLRSRQLRGEVLPPLDGPRAAVELARTLGEELLQDVPSAPAVVIAPAGASAALLGTVHALRTRWPEVRAVALTAADEELPELPRDAGFPGIETRAVSFAEASRARSDLARSGGLLASHAAAAAAALAGENGLAIVTSAGEREFSLERAP
ncbi:MAG TPA: pyridoxal-phosphate dependent enzyme [Myxococcales bacterium]|nr:pyridoxal-phosphate dependent enzyme [Myxococcales bacterium]